MKIFCDYHHGGLARSMFYLFGDRLGHQIRFADPKFAKALDPTGQFFVGLDEKVWLNQMGGIPKGTWCNNAGTVSMEEFMDTDWDIFLFTRPESQQRLWNLNHPKASTIVNIGQAGNENTVYDWSKVQHLLTSDEDTWRLAPPNVTRILTGQELGRHFGKTFEPVTEDGFRVINCFINNLRGQSQADIWSSNDWGNGCPHCGSKVGPKVHQNLWDLWKETSESMGGYDFKVWGHTNDGLSGGANVLDKQLPKYYQKGALTWHVKGFDGWGHSMLQSITCGRPVIVEKRFYRYRTAGNYLIPNVTCFYVDYDKAKCGEAIGSHTKDLDQVNHHAKRCWEAAQGLFDWEHEAWRVKEWMEEML